MRRVVMAAMLTLCFSPARAEVGRVYGFVGGWAYDISGSYANPDELDLEDDLGLHSTARQDYAVGYVPAETGWLPALEFGYTRIAADGQQRFPLLPVAGLLPPSTDVVVDDRTDVNDFELTARWPWRRGAFSLLGGFTVTTLKGSVTAADENNGQPQTQKINETFPQLSVAVQWQPADALRLSLSGDYISYGGNRADELEARLLWKFLGPVGLEVGYRQRHYKIADAVNRLDARVAGARLGLVMEIPL